MASDRNADITRLLSNLADGHDSAAEQLLPLVYEDLRELARKYFQRQQANQTLQPTALVHEAYVKLAHSESHWKDRAHFYAVAATAMRQILVDYARRRKAEKRGGDRERVTLNNLLTPGGEDVVDVVALDEILNRLATLDPRQYRIVELRFFTGLPEQEIAHLIGVSRSTVQADWRAARAWLGKELKKVETE